MYLPKALSIWVMLLLLDECQTIKVEIDLGGTRSKQVRLICMPTDEFQGKKKNTVLWEGLKFGASERDMLAASLKDRDLVPNIKVNSSRFKCFLESRNLDGESELNKKARSNRELAGFIQKEKDNCPPGHRISDDRCYPCPPGSYSSGQEVHCHPCPNNFFNDKVAADACWPCPEEKKTLRVGADSVNFCVDLNRKRLFVGGFNVWFCAGVVLFLFLIVSWIIIVFFVFRYCCWNTTKTVKPVLEEDKDLLKKDGQPLTINYKGKFQKDNTHAKKRKVKFDVDIKGSAILTQKSSSDPDIVDVKIPKDSTSKSHSDSKTHLDSQDHTDSESHIDSRNHTISFITNFKGCKVKDGVLCESLSTSTHRHSEDKINPIVIDSENIKGFEELESDERSLRENEIATDKQDSENSSDTPESERISFVDDSFDSETPHEPQIRESIPDHFKKDRYSTSYVDEKYQDKLAEEKERSESDSIENGTSTAGESMSEPEIAMSQDKEKSKKSKKSRNIRRETKYSYPGKNFVSDLGKKIHEKESKSDHDYFNSEFEKVLQEIKSEPERIQIYPPKSMEENISRHQPEKSVSGIKKRVDKKDSSTQSGARKLKEFVDHTDEPLDATIHKQNGGEEKDEKDSERIHRYPQKSIEEHISKDQPEKVSSGIKKLDDTERKFAIGDFT
ncbi:ephrin_rec_like domain-containing protein [Trichonephila inaurata madagascariensis]|uniref:Ephrin_rec_like domain-containing protein n=1 Tax=Trichonephila inaurata madagascariensis TaxID=2747483 RepID=A0A8X6XKQ7_9ARAC|nr:ephrin_rec_like domain-containing protein [Trichonephila inaurata madagascariensis]